MAAIANEWSAEDELVITREFKVPREQVFKAWTEAERLAEWWGPAGCTLTVHQLELRAGGTFLYSMAMPQGVIYGKFVYHEVVTPERLVFHNCFCDAEGTLTRNPWMPTWPLKVHNTLTLVEKNRITTLTLRGGPINASEIERRTFVEGRSGMQAGFAGTFKQLDAYLESV